MASRSLVRDPAWHRADRPGSRGALVTPSGCTANPGPRGSRPPAPPGHRARRRGAEACGGLSRPHPKWPRWPRPLTLASPSAHVPRAAPGRPRHRPDWQRAPANRGGERFLPANGSGGPRRTAGRPSAPPVRTLPARRPMAAPEERRGSAPLPPRGGAVAVTTTGPAVPAGPGARGPSPTPGSGAVPRAERQSSASSLLPPLLAGRLPVLAGLPPPPARASPPPAPARPAGQRPVPGRLLPRPCGTCPGPATHSPAAAPAGGPGEALWQRRPPLSPPARPRGACPPAGMPRSRRPALSGAWLGFSGETRCGRLKVQPWSSSASPLRTPRSVFSPTCVRAIAPHGQDEKQLATFTSSPSKACFSGNLHLRS
ncbi:proline-rich protein 2-like [Falco cherrug]|uniref:proline-rich protein 2-like n=1 Tax=Falco cherrug TaxID=345164 RepID=UPI00247A040D|nr:proline-rich protein 2-like [Falco cherrug]